MNRRQFLKFCFSSLGAGLGLWALSSLKPGLSQVNAPSSSPVIPALNRWLDNTPGESFDLVALGDMGTGWKAQYDLIKLISANSKQPSNVLLLGDIIYPSAKQEYLEPYVIKPFQSLLDRGFRFFPLWGNHDWAEQKALVLQKYFAAPEYYKFKLGPLECWNLNSNDFNDAQAVWLDKTLMASTAAWKMVNLHHSPYSSGAVHHKNELLIKKLCPILSKNKVDLCLSGHNHLYERTGKIEGVTYIVSGGGSASLHKFEEKVSFPREMIQSVHHYLQLQGNSRVLSIRALNLQGQVFDQLVLNK